VVEQLKNRKWQLLQKHLENFLIDSVRQTGLKSVVVGLSGGLDSAVVSVLLQNVFGKNFLAVSLPTQYSSESSLKDAKELVGKFSMRWEVVEIGEYIETFQNKNIGFSPLRMGNFSARIRMATLYDISAREKALVIGTSNKSEILLGYGTLFGDLASALNPIGDIYKTDLFEFAEYLGVPQSIVSKPPSADLFEGQSDEKEIGYTYAEIDKVLKLYVEDRKSADEVAYIVQNRELTEMLIKRIYQNHFKRKMPVVAKISNRTFGHDFLYSREAERSF
jgi:NAD+ synthase